jgi:hypothetical protein
MPTLDFRNGDVLLDWFPFHGGFHVSGGALIYNGNNLHGAASVPPGQQFSLGSHNFCGSSTDPITETGKLTFRTAASSGLGQSRAALASLQCLFLSGWRVRVGLLKC